MVERPGESSKVLKAQPAAGIFRAPTSKAKGPTKKRSLAAAQKSRAFAMRAGTQWTNKRHSYADKSDSPYIEGGSAVASASLVSHFVSTQNISTYYDGTDQRIITPQEILTSKREEFFNAFRNTGINRAPNHFGGSARQLPVSSTEFGIEKLKINEQDIIHEVSEIESPVKQNNQLISEEPISPVDSTELENTRLSTSQPASPEEAITVQRQPSSTSSSGSSEHHPSSVYTGSTWSISTDMTSSQNTRTRKPSLRRRLQGAFSFQNIRRAISMEKLSEEEKRRSMSHHYLNESGTHDVNGRISSTLPAEKRTAGDVINEPPKIRKAPSLTSLFSTVRMRKRRSRMQRDSRNRNTIAGPESIPDEEDVPDNRRSTLRPMSMILPSTSSRKKTEDVGNPTFFRPIGRVLQMNPAEGTLLVEMVKPPSGPFGFYIARKKDAGDTGSVYISRLSDSYPEKMFAGLMRTGDEITEVNGAKVAELTLDNVYDLILDSEKTLLKIKPSQVHVV